MKNLARSYIWWLDLNQQVEDWAKNVKLGRTKPPRAPLHPWVWPMLLWHHIHLDLAGPVMGKMLLIATDAHSKWPEVQVM